MYGFVILEIFVDMRHYELGDGGQHPVLDVEPVVTEPASDEPLKQRHVKVVSLAELINCRVWSELLMISDEDQVLATCSQAGHDVSLKHLRRLLHNHDRGLDILDY